MGKIIRIPQRKKVKLSKKDLIVVNAPIELLIHEYKLIQKKRSILSKRSRDLIELKVLSLIKEKLISNKLKYNSLMLQNKSKIDAIIRTRKNFEFCIRKHDDPVDKWSKLKPFTEKSEDEIYHNELIDGVMFKFKHTTLIINARHKIS